MKITKGTMLTLSYGEYSDKGWSGPFVVAEDFDQAEVSEVFRAEWSSKPHDEWDRPSEYDFVGWLSLNGYVEDVEAAFDWYIGSYGFSPDIAP